jgi:hypothetical protein
MTVAANPVLAIAQAEALGYRLDVRTLPVPQEPGWRPAHAAARDPLLMERLLARSAVVAGTRARAVAATWHLEKHAWFAAAAALGGLLSRGELPPLDTAWVRDGEAGWVEAVAIPVEGWSPGGGAELADALSAHLEPVVEALTRHRGRRALWRSVGDRLGQAALWAADAFDERALALAADALEAPTPLASPRSFEIVEGRPTRRRTGCCLSHRCDGAIVCADCVLGV